MDPDATSLGEIDRLRRRLDEMDRQLLALLNQRMEVAKRIGERKRRESQLIFDPVREEAVIRDLVKQDAGSLSPLGIRAIFQEIFSLSRAQQGVLRIGCCGGAASLLAAHRRFGSSDGYRMVRSAEEGKRLLVEESIDILVLPKQRLLDWSHWLLRKPDAQSPVTVCGESDLPHLLAIHRMGWRSRFYIIRLGKEPIRPQDGSQSQKAVFLLAGCSREAMDRWRHRFGGCWAPTNPCAGGKEPPDASALVHLWEVFDPPSREALRETCSALCGDSAWIVLLGAYPVSSDTRL
ncbi:chorismate mutase [Verrucomicrobium sp. 3C]|uniref:chorismate mutase n=1 Tax=Verrucomicrobium sp. 3C TaxID=1134055 RepID=UPI000476DA78|nr:chorismate mutase [Verrucomicrobium sp. 3C]